MELLIYIGILAIVTVALVGVFFSLNRGWGQIIARSEVNSNMRFALEKILQDLHAASSVTTPASAGSTTSALDVAIGGVSTKYCVISGQLKREVGAGACGAGSTLVTTDTVNVTGITFKRLENTNVTFGATTVTVEVIVDISYAGTNPERQYSESKKTTISLRQ